MTARVFLDSNVLIYAVSTDRRADIAETLLAGGGVISVQVLNEFANVARKKLAFKPLDIADATHRFCALCEVLPLTVPLHFEALRIAERYRLGFYDSLIVATALAAECSTLYTEDLHDGQTFERKLKLANPFA
jgi:predicted nucleic acid-binding protein